MCSSVFLCTQVCACDLLFINREWKITAGKRSGSWQNKPCAQELPSQDPICPIKKQLQADASSVIFFMGGHRGQKDKHVLSRTGKGAESTWKKKTLMRLIQVIHECINESFVKGKVSVP